MLALFLISHETVAKIGVNTFCWLLALVPALPIPLVYLAYRKILKHKRESLSSLLAQDGVFDSYQKRFGKPGGDRESVVKELFNLYYGPATYVLPIVMNMVVIVMGVSISLAHIKVPFALPIAAQGLVTSFPVYASLGFTGAYILSLYDTLRRARTSDLSAFSLHFTWVHMLLASILAPLVAPAFSDVFAAFVSFGIGLFPIKDTFAYVQSSVKKKLDITIAPEENTGLPMGLVQGLNSEVIDRLEEEGITSIVDLAYYDPIKLFFKTNYAWAWVIDVMDQALLINYLGKEIDAIRPIGIRGAIEMTVAGEPDRKPKVESLIAVAADRLKFTPAEVRSIGITMYGDEQVDLVWQLFRPNDPDENAAPANGQSGGVSPLTATPLPQPAVAPIQQPIAPTVQAVPPPQPAPPQTPPAS